LVILCSAEFRALLEGPDEKIIGVDASFKVAGKGIYQVLSWHRQIGNPVSGIS
jgi:hypothetical protein